jgi:multiple sugar transport system substrate-binding protein
LLEIARQTTFTRESGEQVYGFVCKGSQYEVGNSVIQVLSQMYGGFPWSPSWEVQLNSGPVAKGVELLRTLYSEELMPANWATMDFAEVVKMFQEGRVAMGIYPHNYSTILNNPEQAVSPGSAVPAYLPLATEAQTADRTFAGSFLWFWSMGILSGSDNKDLAWQFIYDLSLRDARLEMARSGNATARISVTAEQESPGVKIAAETSRYSFPANPPSPKSNEIIDTIGDAVHQIVLSDAPLQQTLDRAADRLRELIED